MRSIGREILLFVLNGSEAKDAIHLALASRNNFMIVTGDKRLQEVAKEFYGKVINLRSLL